MTWFGNYEPPQERARFIPAPADEPAQLLEVRWHFRADSLGGGSTGEPCFGDNRRVLAQRAPAWQRTLAERCAREQRSLLVRRIGAAGKYTFWTIVGRDADDALRRAEEHARAIKARADANTVAAMMKSPLKPGYRFVTETGPRDDVVAASYSAGPRTYDVATRDGRLEKGVRGAVLRPDGWEAVDFGRAPCTWLPGERAGEYDPERLEVLEALLDALEARERAAQETRRAAPAARERAALAGEEPATAMALAFRAARKGQAHAAGA